MNGSRWVKGAGLYFVTVFAFGFLLGTVRVTLLLPRLGARWAELLEMPLMVVVSIGVARWVLGRSGFSYSGKERVAMGLLALLFMVCAEFGVATLLLNVPISDVVTKRDPVSGFAYIFALLVFALMPLVAGRGRRAAERPTLIDTFLDHADVSERHEVLVKAPAGLVFDTAEHLDMRSIPLVNAIFRLREILFGIHPIKRAGPKGLVAETLSLGWGVLASFPNRELVMGAVTQPWVGNVKFRPVPPAAFSKFSEPGFVKIAWTLEVEPLQAGVTRFRTQTRVLATDAASRRKFRLYWAFAGPFIVLMRRLLNRALRQEAERQASEHESTLHRFTKGGCVS